MMKTASHKTSATYGRASAAVGYFLGALALLGTVSAPAKDVRVSDTARQGGDIAFNLAWDNSWRELKTLDAGSHVAGDGKLEVENWDAVWVFAKFRKAGAEAWSHATLSTNAADHAVPAGAALDVGLTPQGQQGRGVGAFIYRAESNRGRGANNWKVKLRWLREADGVAASNVVDIQVHAIEMVYVAQGPFALGSGGNEKGRFFKAEDSTKPFIVTSEVEIVTEPFNPTSKTATAAAPSGTGCLWGAGGAVSATYPKDSIKKRVVWDKPWQATDPVILGNTGGSEGHDVVWAERDEKKAEIPPIQAAFPKGFNAFYCMKYEITQGQYAAFLNSLSRWQCGKTFAPSDNSCRYYARSPLSNRYSLQGDWPKIMAATPQVACNFLSWSDGLSYAAWAGLRPMSELEFEKACRGPMKPVSNEYAWGTAEIATDRYEFVQGTAGTDKERLTPKTLSKTAGNAVYDRTRPDLGPLGEWTRADDQVGPLRVGIFETESGDRVASGASFWGIMELSGNLWERTVTVGSLFGRGIKGTMWGSFLGSHGNGSSGVPGDWPGAVGAGFRGGYWLHSAGALRVSDRVSAVAEGADRYAHYGFRAVRTAP